IRMHGQVLMDMSMDFLHEGQPKYIQKTQPFNYITSDDAFTPAPVAELLERLLSQLNICSREFIVTQYDHEVQAGSVLKPLQGPGRVCADATVWKPVFDSPKGVVTSQGIAPRYSDIDCYHMAAASIDIAVRTAVAAGGSIDHMAIMDNFC